MAYMTLNKSRKRYWKILELRKDGKTFRFIANKFFVCKQRIHEIVKRGEPGERGRTKSPFWYKGLKAKGRGLVRGYVRFRDKFTCQNCGEVRTPQMARKKKKRMFDVHHLGGLCGKKSKGYDKVSEMDSLITLCHKCHYGRHDFSQKRMRMLIVS